MSPPLVILSTGMVTSVGLTAPASCAAIRCAINNFNETRFVDRSGDYFIGSEIALDKPWRGLTKLAKAAALAVRECVQAMAKPPKPDASIPLVLCLAEEDRPGRLPGLGGPLLFNIERELGFKFHPDSSVVAQGRVGGAVGLLRAQKLIHERQHAQVILCGADTYLTGAMLAAYEEQDRLLTRTNSNGFIPGEAAAAVVLGRAELPEGAGLSCQGLGFARESATIGSDKPLRGDGMVEATRAALAAAGIGFERVDHRISDVSGEQYRFKEVALTAARLLRQHKTDFGIWHPADCAGEIGAAALPTMLGVLHSAARKRYLPGATTLIHLSNDDDKRAALVVSAQWGG